MKIVLFSILCLFLIGMTSYSYAQWTIVNVTAISPEVFLQSELRDSNGSLIAYVKTEQVIGINPSLLTSFLDNQNQTNKEFIIKDDKKYESHHWEVRSDKFNQKLAYSTTRLIDIHQNELAPLIIMLHDSFQTEPGDVLRLFWKVIRPAS